MSTPIHFQHPIFQFFEKRTPRLAFWDLASIKMNRVRNFDCDTNDLVIAADSFMVGGAIMTPTSMKQFSLEKKFQNFCLNFNNSFFQNSKFSRNFTNPPKIISYIDFNPILQGVGVQRTHHGGITGVMPQWTLRLS